MANRYKEIGQILAAARRDQHKSLQAASENTKIIVDYLEAIEAGASDKLPSPAYFPLFARSYAQYLGLDPAIFDEIEDREVGEGNGTAVSEPGAVSDREKLEAASRVQARKFGRLLIILVVVIIIVFAAFIVYTQYFIKSSRIAEGYEAARPSEAADEVTTGLTGKQADFIVPDEPYHLPEKLKLYMRVNQDVWALVVRDGDTVLNRKLAAGEERAWEAKYRYRLTLGISTAVDLYINDQKLAPLTDRARTISGVEINQINYENFLPGAETPFHLPAPVTPPRSAPADTEAGPAADDSTGETPDQNTAGREVPDGD